MIQPVTSHMDPESPLKPGELAPSLSEGSLKLDKRRSQPHPLPFTIIPFSITPTSPPPKKPPSLLKEI